MQSQDESRVMYEIAYDVTRQLVIVYPKWRGRRPNTQTIGEYAPENARADLGEYVADLGNTISDALARVGQSSIEPFKVMVTPLDGSPEVMIKDFRAPLEKVPVDEQVAVGAGVTAAMAVDQEEKNGTPEEIASFASQEIGKKEAVAKSDKTIVEASGNSGTFKPVAKKAAAKKTSKK